MKRIESSILQKRILEILKKLVETPTPTGEEHKLHDFLTSFLREKGFDVKKQDVPESCPNLIGRRKGGGLLLCAHIDTFPAFDHPDPYKLKLEGENLVGRGVIDPKGQIASLLVAIEYTDSPCEIAFTSGEEEKALGSKFLKATSPQGIVLEPTDFVICLSQAGAIEIEVKVEGTSAHGSLPQEGENAVLKAFEIYRRLTKMPFLKQTHPHFPSGGWVNLGKIQGGKDVMVVPYQCSFQADIGVVPGVNIDQAVREVKNTVIQSGGRIYFRDISPPIQIESKLKVVKLLKESFEAITGKKAKIGGIPSWTDAENLYQKGIFCPVFGAGKLSRAHSNYEWVSLRELELLSLILIHFLDHWNP